jgi:type II secretory pathway component PulJ
MNSGRTWNILKQIRADGMTMVEMMVALLISTLVIFGMVNVYRLANQDWSDAYRLELLQHQTQDALGFLQNDVELAVSTGVATEPLIATCSTLGLSGYGVIIIEENPPQPLDQVDYQLTPLQYNSQLATWMWQLQRLDCTTYDPKGPPPGLPQAGNWQTLLKGITVTTTPFTVTTMTNYGTPTPLYHPSLTIGTETVWALNEPGLLPATEGFNPTFTMRGDVLLQEGS